MEKVEIWKDIIGFDGKYQISNKGRVRSFVRRNKDLGGTILHSFKRRNLHYVNVVKDGKYTSIVVEKILFSHFDEFKRERCCVQNLPGEIWKDIKGFEGKYMCSNKGRIKTLSRDYLAGMNYACVRHVDEALLKPMVSKRGYLRVDLRTGTADGHCMKWVHNLVVRTFFNNYDMSLVPNHIDGNKQNNNIENLELITVKGNNEHAIKTGLHKVYGCDNPGALLTYDIVKEIRLAFISGIRVMELAKKYNVGRWVINGVVYNKSYKDENYKLIDNKWIYIK